MTAKEPAVSLRGLFQTKIEHTFIKWPDTYAHRVVYLLTLPLLGV